MVSRRLPGSLRSSVRARRSNSSISSSSTYSHVINTPTCVYTITTHVPSNTVRWPAGIRLETTRNRCVRTLARAHVILNGGRIREPGARALERWSARTPSPKCSKITFSFSCRESMRPTTCTRTPHFTSPANQISNSPPLPLRLPARGVRCGLYARSKKKLREKRP